MTTLPQNIDPDFEIYPAIDLHEGQVVRLKQGDLTRETVYSQNPAHIERGLRVSDRHQACGDHPGKRSDPGDVQAGHDDGDISGDGQNKGDDEHP